MGKSDLSRGNTSLSVNDASCSEPFDEVMTHLDVSQAHASVKPSIESELDGDKIENLPRL